MLPGTGGTQRLVRIVGKSRAIELMVTGRLFDFEEAQGYGIVNQIFEARRLHGPGPRLRQAVLPAEQGGQGGRPDQARRCSPAPRFRSSTALALERELQQQLFQSDDAKEGLAAYVEKRAPQFKGA